MLHFAKIRKITQKGKYDRGFFYIRNESLDLKKYKLALFFAIFPLLLLFPYFFHGRPIVLKCFPTHRL